MSQVHFYARKQLLLSARLSHRNTARPTVRPSVRLSVRLIHGWISQKQCKSGSSLPSTAWKTLVLGTKKFFHKFERSRPERGC